MAFIQLYISKSQRGHQHLTDINGNESVRRHIYDFRSATGQSINPTRNVVLTTQLSIQQMTKPSIGVRTLIG